MTIGVRWGARYERLSSRPSCGEPPIEIKRDPLIRCGLAEQKWFEDLEKEEQKRTKEEQDEERNEETTPLPQSQETTRDWLKGAIAFFCVVVFLVPYILARFFLLVEVFRTLCFLPPDAFVDTWSGSLPHFG
jgi:hypothetical protein